MNKNNKILLIRLIYLIGVVLDSLFAMDMTVITLFGVTTPLSWVYTLPEKGVIDLPYRYAMGLAAAMMWGWTILLIWGLKEPLERKGILLLTTFPVTGLMLSNMFAGMNSLISSVSLLLRPVIFIGLGIMFTSGYLLARDAIKGD